MYSFKSKVRYSEVDKNAKLKIPSIINYFQDCTTLHSETLGVGVNHLKEKDRAWVLNSWQIEFLGEAEVFSEIETGTWSYGFKGAYGYRNFVMNKGEERIVNANSLWVFTDTKNLRPVKVTEEEGSIYGAEEKLQMKEFDRKIKVIGDGIECEPFKVRKYHIDTNGHVNNEKYVEFAMEYLREDKKIKYLRAEYKKAAVYGDTICPVVYETEEELTVDLKDKEGNTYAIVQLIYLKGTGND